MAFEHLTHDLLADAILGAAAPEARAHIEGCERCRAELEALRPLLSDLRALEPRPAGDPALVRRILDRLEAPSRKRRVFTRRPAFWRWIAAGMAAAAAIVVIGLAARRERPMKGTSEITRTPEPPPRVEIPRPEPRPAPAPAPVPPAPPPAPPTPPPAPPPQPVPPEIEEPLPPPEPLEPPPAPARPPPGETRPAPAFLAVARVEGTLEGLEEKRWQKLAAKPFSWRESAPLRTAERPARIILADGARVALRPRTELRLFAAEPPSLLLEQGEVYCDVPPLKRGGRFQVLTAEARVQVVGTQFSVRRNGQTEVAVAGGEVQVANEKGEVAVPAGTGTAVRKGAAPTKPRALDTDRIFAWRRELDPPEKVRFRFDFEDGRRPFPWTNGRASAAPARGANRFCLEGERQLDAELYRMESKANVVHGPMIVRFRYFVPAGTEILVQFSCERTQDNFRYEVKNPVHGKWESVEAPLSAFFRMADPSMHPQEGDRFSWLNITVWGTDGPVYFDDIELVEVLGP